MKVQAVKTTVSTVVASSAQAAASPRPVVARHAIIGGGVITTPAVAAHLRKRITDRQAHAVQTKEA